MALLHTENRRENSSESNKPSLGRFGYYCSLIHLPNGSIEQIGIEHIYTGGQSNQKKKKKALYLGLKLKILFASFISIWTNLNLQISQSIKVFKTSLFGNIRLTPDPYLKNKTQYHLLWLSHLIGRQ